MKPRILAIGTIRSDFCLEVSRFPEAGETVSDDGSRSFRPGGRGPFASAAFARLGADTLFCGKTGSDTDGARLKQFLVRYGVDTRFMATSRTSPTDFAIVVGEDSGKRRTLIFPGASDLLSPEDIEEAFTSYPDSVFIQLDIPVSCSAAALRFASKQGIPVIADMSAGTSRTDLEQFAAAGKPELLIIDEKEAEEISGIVPSGSDSCVRASIAIASVIRSEHYIIKLGQRGTFVYDNRFYRIIPSFENDTVDPDAGEEAFSAALAWQFISSHDLVSAVKFASAVKSLTVSRKGGMESIPTLSEVNDFIGGSYNV